jgi:hypothetical protein
MTACKPIPEAIQFVPCACGQVQGRTAVRQQAAAQPRRSSQVIVVISPICSSRQHRRNTAATTSAVTQILTKGSALQRRFMKGQADGGQAWRPKIN